MSLDAGAKGSVVEEPRRKIEDYYNVFKIEINKDYFLAKAGKANKMRRNSAKFFSINQKNAFNFNLEKQAPAVRLQRSSLMNTSIDQIKSGKQRDLAELGEDLSQGSDLDRKKMSGFFLENLESFGKERLPSANKKSLYYENNIYTIEVNRNQKLSDSGFKAKPRFSLDVHEYQAPKVTEPGPYKPIHSPFLPHLKTNAALYNNKILEESRSKGASPAPAPVPGEKTVSSKVYPSPLMRSSSLRESRQTDHAQASLLPRASQAYLHHSHEHCYSHTFQRVSNPEQLNLLLQKQTQPPLQNWSMFPKREHPRLHNSSNLLPNSEDIRQPKVQPKPSLQSNVHQLRFQNYQTIASLKSEMNLMSKKINYKKKQRQVLKNFRHPQSPFVNGRPTFKSSSSIESGDSDQEMKLDKLYCTLCGEDFG